MYPALQVQLFGVERVERDAVGLLAEVLQRRQRVPNRPGGIALVRHGGDAWQSHQTLHVLTGSSPDTTCSSSPANTPWTIVVFSQGVSAFTSCRNL